MVYVRIVFGTIECLLDCGAEIGRIGNGAAKTFGSYLPGSSNLLVKVDSGPLQRSHVGYWRVNKARDFLLRLEFARSRAHSAGTPIMRASGFSNYFVAGERE